MHFYMHSYLHKIFILVKSGCYSDASGTGLGGVLMALQTWQHYLLENVVHIYTDHKSLKYIFT
jgi:hypothetical protein